MVDWSETQVTDEGVRSDSRLHITLQRRAVCSPHMSNPGFFQDLMVPQPDSSLPKVSVSGFKMSIKRNLLG